MKMKTTLQNIFCAFLTTLLPTLTHAHDGTGATLPASALSVNNIIESLLVEEGQTGRFTVHNLYAVSELLKGLDTKHHELIRYLTPAEILPAVHLGQLSKDDKGVLFKHFPNISSDIRDASSPLVLQVFTFISCAFGKEGPPVFLYVTRPEDKTGPDNTDWKETLSGLNNTLNTLQQKFSFLSSTPPQNIEYKDLASKDLFTQNITAVFKGMNYQYRPHNSLLIQVIATVVILMYHRYYNPEFELHLDIANSIIINHEVIPIHNNVHIQILTAIGLCIAIYDIYNIKKFNWRFSTLFPSNESYFKFFAAHGVQNYKSFYAHHLYKSGNLKEALKWFLESAKEDNNANSHFMCYSLLDKEWMESMKSAKENNNVTSHLMSHILCDEEQMERIKSAKEVCFHLLQAAKLGSREAHDKIKTSAETGDQVGQFYYGRLLYTGCNHVPENRFESTIYFIKSADQGFLPAKWVLHDLMPQTFLKPDTERPDDELLQSE